MPTELSNEQRRQLIDATQVFEVWRQADREFKHSYRGSMHWRKSGGREYLGRKYGSSWDESFGVRSKATENIKAEYTEGRTRLRQRATKLRQRITSMAPVNRALRLGRMPETPARILRKLDEVGLLDGQLIVVGTHSMFAYEARSGVLFESDLTATSDIDLLIDARHRLSLAVSENIPKTGIMGLLQSVDRSFNRTNVFRATNSDGYYVDLIAPLRRNEVTAPAIKLVSDNDELAAAAVIGLQWLINAPRMDAVLLADDGLPLWMPCIDPRAFALHKWWMSQRLDRDPIKKRRDAAQARSVYEVATDYLNLDFKAKDLSALPLELTRAAKDLAGAGQKRAARKPSF